MNEIQEIAEEENEDEDNMEQIIKDQIAEQDQLKIEDRDGTLHETEIQKDENRVEEDEIQFEEDTDNQDLRDTE